MTDLDEEWELPDLSGVTDIDDLTPEELERLEAEILAEELGEAPAKPKSKLSAAQRRLARDKRMMTVEDLFDLPPIKWFVEGLLPAAPRTVVYGAGGSYKSFLVLDWVLSASEGLEWQGRPVEPGKVLYILGEGAAGTAKRLRAWGYAHGIDPRKLENVHFMASPINLFTLTDEQTANWAAILAELGYQYIVVDTLHTAMPGGEESSSKDIGIVYARAAEIAGTAKLIFVHHDTKGGKSGGRGSSAIRDDADVVVLMTKDEDVPHTATLLPDKLRDADEFAPLRIEFDVWVPEGGDPIDGAPYVVRTGEGDAPDKKAPRRSAADCLLDFLSLRGEDPKALGWGGIKRVCEEAGYTVGKNTITQALRQASEEIVWDPEG